MTDRLSPEREAEIAARAEAATAGPWGFYDGETYADVAADLQITGRGSYSYREKVARLEDENYWDDAAHEEDDEERASEQMAANAAFIAHARTDVPALLAELAAVRTERDQAQAKLVDQADADTLAARAAQAISAMGAEIRTLTSERNRYRSAWRNAREQAASAQADVEFVEHQSRTETVQ